MTVQVGYRIILAKHLQIMSFSIYDRLISRFNRTLHSPKVFVVRLGNLVLRSRDFLPVG